MMYPDILGTSGGAFESCAFCNLFSAMSTLMQVKMFGHLKMGHQEYVKLDQDACTDLKRNKDGLIENVELDAYSGLNKKQDVLIENVLDGDNGGNDSDFDCSKAKNVLVENIIVESDLNGGDTEEANVKPKFDKNFKTNENSERKFIIHQNIDDPKNTKIKAEIDQCDEEIEKEEKYKLENEKILTEIDFNEESSKNYEDSRSNEVKTETNEGFDSLESNEDGSLTRCVTKEVDLQGNNSTALHEESQNVDVQAIALNVSKKKRSYSCPDCTKQFWFHKSLLSHCNSHHNRSESDCPPKMLKYENMKNRAESFACSDCDKTFHVQRRLTDHINKCHVKTSSTPCEQCGKLVKNSNMDTHIRINHEAARFSCEFCPKTFYYNSGLKLHEDVHKDVNEKTSMLCVECGNTYTSRNALRRHVNSVHKNIRHPCYWCHKQFTSNQHLQKHILTHTNPHIYMCTLCEAKFLHKDNHRMHVIKSHPGQDYKNIVIVMDSNDKGEVIFEINNVKKKIVIEKGKRNSLRQVQ